MTKFFLVVGCISVSIALVMVGESSPTVHPAAWIMLFFSLLSFFTAWLFNQPYEL